MQAALKRKRDNRQPADSGEYQPVPIRYITLPQTRRLWAAQIEPSAGKGPRQWMLLPPMVPVLQAIAAAAIVYAFMPLLGHLPGALLFLLALVLPSLSAAVPAAIVSLWFALLGGTWGRKSMPTMMAGVAVWAAIPPAFVLIAYGIHSSPTHNPSELVWTLLLGLLAGAFVAVASIPGASLAVKALDDAFEPLARRRQRKAVIREQLLAGWRAQ